MGKILLDPGALLAPVPPVIVTCGDRAENNLITIGWTGILNTKPPMTYISVRPERHSYGIIRRTGEFVINLTDSTMARATDICGMYTGKKRDKWKLAELTPEKSGTVACPSVAESPLSLECKVERIIPLGTHHVFMARIVAVRARDELVDGDGRLRLDKAELMAYSHGEYFAIGKKLGKFGFSTVKKGYGKTADKRRRTDIAADGAPHSHGKTHQKKKNRIRLNKG